jgi:hypothetical protein
MISGVLIFSCLALSYLPMFYLVGSQDEKDSGKQFRVLGIVYILTNGFIPSVLMMIFILLTNRNIRHSRQQSVSLSFVSDSG